MSSNLQGSALESYLIREVQTLCDADPDLVAQYITALIGSSDPPHVLRQSLDEKLREFFGDQTGPFIDRLFKELGYDSNDRHNSNSHSRAPERSRRPSDYSDEEDDGDRNFKHRRPRSEAARDNDGRYSRSSEDDRHYSSSGSSRDRRHDSYGGSRHSRNDDYRTGANSIPRGPAAMYDHRQQPPSSSLPSHRGGRGGYRGDMSGGRPRRPLCRDYNEKGYCMRGDMCPYDHGADRIVVDDGSFATPAFPNVSSQMGPPMTQQQQAPPPPFFGMPGSFDAYDPERATLMPNSGNMASFPTDMPGMMMPTPSDNMGSNRMFATPRGGMRGRGGRGGRGRGGGNMGAGHQKRQGTTLVVENIPTEFCEISKVNEYFKKFGSLTNISVQSHMHKAILQFATNAEASAAYSSPDPIFDNRFVKVYWYKENEDENKAAGASSDAAGGRTKADTASPSSSTTTPMKRQSEPDPEEVAARAAELAKLREEKQKKHQERMKAILDVQKQKEQLLQKQIEEQKQLMEKLSNSKNMTKAEKEELLKSLKKIANDIDISRAAKASALPPSMTTTTATSASVSAPEPTGETTDGAPATTSEDLAAKLAKLEAEAASLGITPQSYGGGYRGGRGGYYGRGRGYPRMRGGGAVRYSLDNRPTKIFVKGVPEDAKNEMRNHFEQFGNVTMLETHEDGIIVDYSQRFESEKAMMGGTNTPRGKLEFSWYTGAMPSNGSSQRSTPTTTTTTTTAATASEAQADDAA